jgi:hypothetical protein
MGKKAEGQKAPLVVNLTDFSAVLHRKEFTNLSESTLVKEVAFVIIESLLTWLSSLEDDDRTVFLEAMNDDESALCYNMRVEPVELAGVTRLLLVSASSKTREVSSRGNDSTLLCRYVTSRAGFLLA